ncbi:hypothetical protein E1301_Tti001551 [Triplophysa tibetana]|uniref:Uncharacterized protein n=1 Tax=Triplophysa tibetana TaxID=1572043 RepID=A0A5A9P871_9TELE|nr:hypothetical protein E1301_Tti001551 [Triplophysa tibetana]
MRQFELLALIPLIRDLGVFRVTQSRARLWASQSLEPSGAAQIRGAEDPPGALAQSRRTDCSMNGRMRIEVSSGLCSPDPGRVAPIKHTIEQTIGLIGALLMLRGSFDTYRVQVSSINQTRSQISLQLSPGASDGVEPAAEAYIDIWLTSGQVHTELGP